MGQPTGPGQLTGDLLNTTPSAPVPPGAPPLPLPVTGDVQVEQGPVPVPPPDPAAAGADAAKAAFAASYSGTGWEFEVDGLDEVINGLQDVIDTALLQVHVRRDIRPSGDEMASHRYATAASQSLAAFNAAHAANQSYLQAYVDTLRQVRDAYLRQDQEALDALRGAAGKD